MHRIQDTFHKVFYLDNLANVASLDRVEPSSSVSMEMVAMLDVLEGEVLQPQ
jgi:hypothetical protein